MTQLHTIQFLITDHHELVLIGPAGTRVVKAPTELIAALQRVCPDETVPAQQNPVPRTYNTSTPITRVKTNFIYTNFDYYTALAKLGENEFTSDDLAKIILADKYESNSGGTNSRFSSFLHRAHKRNHVVRLEGGIPFRYRLTTQGLDYLTETKAPKLL